MVSVEVANHEGGWWRLASLWFYVIWLFGHYKCCSHWGLAVWEVGFGCAGGGLPAFIPIKRLDFSGFVVVVPFGRFFYFVYCFLVVFSGWVACCPHRGLAVRDVGKGGLRGSVGQFCLKSLKKGAHGAPQQGSLKTPRPYPVFTRSAGGA